MCAASKQGALHCRWSVLLLMLLWPQALLLRKWQACSDKGVLRCTAGQYWYHAHLALPSDGSVALCGLRPPPCGCPAVLVFRTQQQTRSVSPSAMGSPRLDSAANQGLQTHAVCWGSGPRVPCRSFNSLSVTAEACKRMPPSHVCMCCCCTPAVHAQ